MILGEASIVGGVKQPLEEMDVEHPAFYVHMNETQVIREAGQVMTVFTDGIIRPCTVCWAADLETGQHQFLACAREMVPRRVRRAMDPGGSVADVCNHRAPPHHKSAILLDSGANEVL